MIANILKCIFILHHINIATSCLCRDPGLVHPLLGEIHKHIDDRMTKGFDDNDLDYYVKVKSHRKGKKEVTSAVC